MTSPSAKTLGLVVDSESPGGEQEEGGKMLPALVTHTPAADKFSAGVKGDLGWRYFKTKSVF